MAIMTFNSLNRKNYNKQTCKGKEILETLAIVCIHSAATQKQSRLRTSTKASTLQDTTHYDTRASS